MSYDDQRRHYAQLKADRGVIEQAAAHLRHRAILDGYVGSPREADRVDDRERPERGRFAAMRHTPRTAPLTRHARQRVAVGQVMSC